MGGMQAKVAVKAGVLDGVLNAGPLVQALLLGMILLSVVSWAIIFTKSRQFKKVRAANQKFVDAFWRAPSLEDMFARVREHDDSNAARVFAVAFAEMQRIAESAFGGKEAEIGGNHRLTGMDNLERSLRKSIDNEMASAESRLNFLATTGSTAPFIGLLGTVLGIMTSFQQIASAGSASLAVVAPGISEALFATAVGLFAALPATAAYNYFVGQVRRIEMELTSFSADFLNVAKRNFFRDQ